MTAYIDTHIAVWLYAGLRERFSTRALDALECHALMLPPMAYLELQYLYQLKRISLPPEPVLATLSASFGVELCSLPFATVAQAALGISWNTDPFDGLIVAQAISAGNAPLITADERIRERYGPAVW